MLPEWEYIINAFDTAVRDVTCCECEQGQCEHVDAYNAAREELAKAFYLRDGKIEAYAEYQRGVSEAINSFGAYHP